MRFMMLMIPKGYEKAGRTAFTMFLIAVHACWMCEKTNFSIIP